ncbi:hypothetical protein [Rhinolophus gammaherpesvirus 1]|uniref:Envelope protein UL43 n=1 Tax=Rhinolophus gammaherpesvirus 1 TaxID=2054179 RepID=A0A2Z5U786_9GAMA|nr:hypothetical protein [Rhinolophus gammaherpesvirus 1]BBB06511.1 hypothetical protein [Rhinolophus gammaherpesvirus 1]
MEDAILILSSFACGLLAVTPFIWCFLFRSIFPPCILSVYNDTLYSWATVATQMLMVAFCFKRYSRTLSKSLIVICAFNVLLLMACLVCIKLRQYAFITVPIIFSLNLVLLSVWMPVAYETVFLCSSHIHVYFQIGFYTGIMSYYAMIHYGEFTSSFLFVPFVSYLTFGLYAFKTLKKHSAFKSALLDKKAIFISKDNLYVTLSLRVIPAMIGTEIFLVFSITSAFIIFLLSVEMYTELLFALKIYILVFNFGSFCSGGFCYPAHWMTLLYVIGGGICMTPVFVLESLSYKSLFFFGVFFCFINSINGEFAIMHQKLKKGINGSKIVLSFCLVVNILLSVTLNVLNRVQYENKKI